MKQQKLTDQDLPSFSGLHSCIGEYTHTYTHTRGVLCMQMSEANLMRIFLLLFFSSLTWGRGIFLGSHFLHIWSIMTPHYSMVAKVSPPSHFTGSFWYFKPQKQVDSGSWMMEELVRMEDSTVRRYSVHFEALEHTRLLCNCLTGQSWLSDQKWGCLLMLQSFLLVRSQDVQTIEIKYIMQTWICFCKPMWAEIT